MHIFLILEDVDNSVNIYRSVARRKTDLMPTVPNTSNRSFYGSRSSLGSLTPRSPGMYFIVLTIQAKLV